MWILDALKTAAGDRPGAAPGRPTGGDPGVQPPAADWHRRQGVEANNSRWTCSASTARPRRTRSCSGGPTPRRTTGSGAGSASPANEARASYLIARALVATGQPERGLVSAERCLAQCERHGLADFDLAYAHEARARALAALGRSDEAAAAMAAARAVPIADPEDLAVVEQDFADLPG